MYKLVNESALQKYKRKTYLQHGPPDRVNLLTSAPPSLQNGEKEGGPPQEGRPDDRQLMPPPPVPPSKALKI